MSFQKINEVYFMYFMMILISFSRHFCQVCRGVPIRVLREFGLIRVILPIIVADCICFTHI